MGDDQLLDRIDSISLKLGLVGFAGHEEVWQPMFWVLAVLSMTVGNLVALRQTNIVRLFAYSSIAQGGYILAPLAIAGESTTAREEAIGAIVVYLLVYGAMNLGAFAVILAVPFTSAVATLIDVLVLDHDPPAAQARRPVRIRRTA